MATDRNLLKSQEAGALLSLGASDPIAAAAQAHSDYFQFTKASDDGMASTTTAETRCFIYLKRACQLKSVTYVATTGGITADASNNAVITLYKRTAAGASQTSVASLTTNVALGNVTQDAGVAFTLTSANVAIAAGSTLTFDIAKGGTGVIVRAGVFVIEVEWTGA